ncbi:MAG TPA: monovalent cation:proton antiporter-2 (CPA2) family protein [Longimicrobiaceae bacterium]
MHDTSHLRDILVLLAFAIGIVMIFRRVRAGSVLGYLIAGMIVGPYGLSLVHEVERMAILGEFGVVFLLFGIGLELSFERLMALRRLVFGLGGAQVLITAVVVWVVARTLGMENGAAVVLGGGLALSSSAIVLQMMAERGDLSAPHGRAAFGVLLFQDLAVVPLLALVPLLGQEDANVATALGVALLKGVAFVVGLTVLGRILLRPIFHTVARERSGELFTGITLLLVLGIGWMTQEAGLSMGMGAFLAGLLIAETEYVHQVEADIEPFKGILLALFFMVVGMSLDIRLALQNAPTVLALVTALVLVKFGILAALCRAFGFAWGASLRAGLVLSQGGEFAFVLFTLAVAAGALPDSTAQLLTLTVGLSMAVTPGLMFVGRTLEQRLSPIGVPGANMLEEAADLEGHVLIAGYGRVGRTVARLLDAGRIPYVAVDRNAETVAAERSQGHAVYFGDAGRDEVLEAAGAKKARVAVITVDDPRGAERAVHALRHIRADLPILVRAQSVEQCEVLIKAGATHAIPELIEGSLQLGEELLVLLGDERSQARVLLDTFRQRAYARLGDMRPHVAPAGEAIGEKIEARS